MARLPSRVTRSLRVHGFAIGVFVALTSLTPSCSRERLSDTRAEGSIEDVEALSERVDVKVLFVLIDTLRADRLGAYGYHRRTSPTLDYLAATGLRFTRHLAQSSWTKASMASLWTSLYPQHNGVTRFDDAMSQEFILPAEIFREAGFRTAGIWRNGWVAPIFNFDQGFELYQSPAARPLPAGLAEQNPHLMLQRTDDHVIDEAVEFIRTRRNERWLLYLHLMDVHQFIYDEETAVFGTTRSDIYDNAILREDKLINRLFAELSKEGQLERTLVIIGSDHGEAFLERGLEGHARHVYRETTEVPMIVSFPFLLPQLEVRARTRNVDIWPTVLDLLGLPPLAESDGVSRLPEIVAAGRDAGRLDRANVGEGSGIAHIDRTWGRPNRSSAPAVALVDGRFRLLYSRKESGLETIQLYDRIADPSELRDVAAGNPEVTAEMTERVKRYLDSSPVPSAAGTMTVELDEMQLHHLRALGYSIPR